MSEEGARIPTEWAEMIEQIMTASAKIQRREDLQELKDELRAEERLGTINGCAGLSASIELIEKAPLWTEKKRE